MRRFQIAQYIAAAATAASVIGGIILINNEDSSLGTLLMCIGFMAGLVSYIFGGFGTAVKMSASIAKWGWIVMPFPYDIVTFFLSFAAAVMAFAFFPIIPVRKAYKESMYC